ncbi:uncharacterized protein DUF3787 [Ruminiclostridium sufflavum DSM 19573]|uniref:Uncharacterized protein DUF3787 n=1 Tax=Ruminiclostridium sufflavum DSM 19573 TaxID=1121337 RepID=A0A318XP13_9FIRM|nr:DUF3787 domain-containing protein [Ruminiclostridium sufflavum]PYG87808.1 uncharacterized protein DUF3787 [Ruminiclostridium sufflavum DSM 19573]
MTKNKVHLNSSKNDRLTSHKPTNNEGTAAWADEKHKQKNSDVSIPSLDNVINAKEWVDNGSKL